MADSRMRTSHTSPCPPRAGDRLRAAVTWVSLVAVSALVWLGSATSSTARVDPYYVLRDPMAARLRPRFLVVFDTSAAMARVLRDTDGDDRGDADDDCTWDQCESADAEDESRISLARRGFKELVASTAGQVNWALMTFDQLAGPTSNPSGCPGGRFQWVDDARTEDTDMFGHFGYEPISAYEASGVTGKWRLCSGDAARPYPYLRWDRLGVGSVITANGQTGPVPSSPLISVANGDINSASNASRTVQWFPRFMGVRTQLNATTDADRAILNATYGDYGNTTTLRNSNVWGQDFYYWPYVDGFPGYARHEFRPGSVGNPTGGIADEDAADDYATLYSPFYLTFNEANISRDRWGPTSLAESNRTMLNLMNPITEGGIDAASTRVPWLSVIGDVPTPANALPDWSARYNTVRSHTSIASYLHFVKTVPLNSQCTPLSLILVAGSRASSTAPDESGPPMLERLAAIRNELGVKVYVVGIDVATDIPNAMTSPPAFPPDPRAINAMACAGAGACDGACFQPCSDTPANDWDTCANPDDRANIENGCAFRASSMDQLRGVLDTIVGSAIDVEVDSGPASDLSDLYEDDEGEPYSIQTRIRGYTEFPGWRGHVTREYCTLEDEDGELLPQCVPPAVDPFPVVEETFGPCPQDRSWDAGECLQQTDWQDRRIYTHDASGNLVRLATDDGDEASAAFRAELVALGIAEGSDTQEDADALLRFLAGADWPGGWKLPGLAHSAPVLVRRIPPFEPNQFPTVNIRDPHCAGRLLTFQDDQFLPPSLEEFAEDSNVAGDTSPEYQQAVIVGDDLGLVHAFQYDSGNELWAFIPRFLLANAERQRQNGAQNMGQPAAVADHLFGVGGTANAGYAFDPGDASDTADDTWRHVLVMGLAGGGGEYFALDVSHMNPDSSRGPIEVLWTTEDAALRDDYEPLLGETWARPALSYRLPGGDASDEPETLVVLGSGYRGAADTGTEGRHLVLADAVTGEIEESARMPAPPAYTAVLGPVDPDFGAIVDPAVVSHCVSGIWAEIEEVYVPDPAGRLYRWDIGENLADSDQDWDDGNAYAADTLRACQVQGSDCHGRVNSSDRSDPFYFGAAVTANDRLDDSTAFSDPVGRRDEEILVALASGSPYDPRNFDLFGSGDNELVHTSLYLMADNHHRAGTEHQGFFPQFYSDQPTLRFNEFGNFRDWMRMAATEIRRTRTVVPYPGASPVSDTANFSPRTRPLRAPRIRVQGLVDADSLDDDAIVPVEGIEAYFVSYYLYEPPGDACDNRFYDPVERKWYPDYGDAYEVVFAVLGTSGDGFDFGFADDHPDYMGFDVGGLDEVRLVQVNQLGTSDCVGGCGSQVQPTPSQACTGETPAVLGEAGDAFSLAISSKPVEGFTPYE